MRCVIYHKPHCRAGFTLIEMLISVTLVLVMMTLFAQIFGIATESMSTQRGIAENDQRARSVTTILRNDLDKRTFRYVMPYYVGEDTTASVTPASARRGYFYVSTNDPDDYLDDILQFTVDSQIVVSSLDQTEYVGRASKLTLENDRRHTHQECSLKDPRLYKHLQSPAQ